MDFNQILALVFGVVGAIAAIWGISTNKKLHEKLVDWFPSMKSKVTDRRASQLGAQSSKRLYEPHREFRRPLRVTQAAMA